MTWLVSEMLRPFALRVGGQVSVFLAAVGMENQHQAAAAAIVAWGVITLGEAVIDVKSRRALVEKAKKNWGRN